MKQKDKFYDITNAIRVDQKGEQDIKGGLPGWVTELEPTYNKAADAYQIAILQKEMGEEIIPGFAFGKTKEICMANARLIAAAPRLVEALREVSQLLDGLINRTETGKKRNELCDLNIKVKSILNSINQ